MVLALESQDFAGVGLCGLQPRCTTEHEEQLGETGKRTSNCAVPEHNGQDRDDEADGGIEHAAMIRQS